MQNKVETICQGLFGLALPRVKAYQNLVWAMCSSTNAKSVVSLTACRHYHYHYSNLSKVSSLFTETETDYEKTFRKLVCYYLASCSVKASEGVGVGVGVGVGGGWYHLAQDMCFVDKSDSECLEGRVYSYHQGRVRTGYKLVCTHLNVSKNWGMLLAMSVLSPPPETPVGSVSKAEALRLATKQDVIKLAVSDLSDLLSDPNLPFSAPDVPCTNTADSGFGNAKYLCPLYAHEQLVNIVRLRSGMKVYPVFSGAQLTHQNPRVYGDTHYLSCATADKERTYTHKKTKEKHTVSKHEVSIMDYPCDHYREDTFVCTNGRKAIRKVWRWNNFLLRSKKGYNMKDKPFDILKVEIWDETNTKKIFQRDMFLAVAGKSKANISAQEAHNVYRNRFEVEKCYRFSKQEFFLEDFQTPDKQHFLNHLLVILSAWWLLYAAREDVIPTCPIWQQYLPENKAVQCNTAIQESGALLTTDDQKTPLTPSQVRKGMADLFDTFDKTPYLPQKSKKGTGRKKGNTLTKRTPKKAYKKPKKHPKKE